MAMAGPQVPPGVGAGAGADLPSEPRGGSVTVHLAKANWSRVHPGQASGRAASGGKPVTACPEPDQWLSISLQQPNRLHQ